MSGPLGGLDPLIVEERTRPVLRSLARDEPRWIDLPKAKLLLGINLDAVTNWARQGLLRSRTLPTDQLQVRLEDDGPIWETAVVAGAQFVVSHNTSDFPPLIQGRHVFGGVEYLTAVEFIQDILAANFDQLDITIPPSATIRSGRSA